MPSQLILDSLDGFSATELVQRLIDFSISLGVARARQNGGMMGGCKKDVALTQQEVLRRLGVEQSAEILNRGAFLFLAEKRRRSLCVGCHLKPPKGRGLAFWTRDIVDPVPLPLMMAWALAPAEKVAEALENCLALCRKCAKKRGGKLLSNGNPDLRSYGAEVL